MEGMYGCIGVGGIIWKSYGVGVWGGIVVARQSYSARYQGCRICLTS